MRRLWVSQRARCGINPVGFGESGPAEPEIDECSQCGVPARRAGRVRFGHAKDDPIDADDSRQAVRVIEKRAKLFVFGSGSRDSI